MVLFPNFQLQDYFVNGLKASLQYQLLKIELVMCVLICTINFI